jgi:hypothetical protein
MSEADIAKGVVFLVGIAAAILTVYAALNRESRGAYLCDDCKFNDPQKCQRKQRPHALICTSYRRVPDAAPSAESSQPA